MPEYTLIRSRRRTMALHIRGDGTLEVRAPLKLSTDVIDAFVAGKQSWVAKHLARMQQNKPVAKSYTEGEQFLFLGKSYPLQFCDEQKAPVVLGETLCLASRLQGRAEKVLTGWYRQQAMQTLSERVAFYSEVMKSRPKQIKLSNARQRWGSCSVRGRVNFAWRLVMAPPEIIDYVVVHELAHLLRHDHSSAFWQIVQTVLPDYKTRRNWLKEKGRLLTM